MPNWIKKCIGCLLLLVFCYVLLSVIKTYGLFEDDLNKEVQNTAASFVLVINSSYINGDNNTFIIDKINTNNTNASANKLAPGSTGYFDIILDPSHIDVAVKYDITFDLSKITNSKIKMVSVINNTNSTALIKTAANTYTGVISLADVNNDISNTIRVNMVWENDETNNDVDSTNLSGGTLEIPVNILLTQYTGEDIVVYTGE